MILFWIAFSWMLLCILAMEALFGNKDMKRWATCVYTHNWILCTSVAWASSLILIASICCSHLSCSSKMWDSSSESVAYGNTLCNCDVCVNPIIYPCEEHPPCIIYLVVFSKYIDLFSELLNTNQLHRVLLILSRERYTITAYSHGLGLYEAKSYCWAQNIMGQYTLLSMFACYFTL